MSAPRIVVLRGGVSREREVSLGSGLAALEGLRAAFDVRDAVLDAAALPADLDPVREVVFPVLHGTFGEDGTLQDLLEAAGVAYAGCDAAASRLAFDKEATKRAAAAAGVRVARGVAFAADAPPAPEDVVAALGGDLVLKPRAEGSSVGLEFPDGVEGLREALGRAAQAGGAWLVEQRILGEEITVGILEGRALGVVGIRPHSGRFDYVSKYTKGRTEYLCPAPIPEASAEAARAAAERTFAAIGGRDFARLDFIVDASGEPVLLEVNTLPGLKETSLLPMSARLHGHDFRSLVAAMVAPALRRHAHRHAEPSPAR